MSIHVADQPLAGQIEGGFKVGSRNGLVADADLATSLAAAKAAVATKTAAKHVSDQPLGNTVQGSLDKVDGVVLPGASTGGSLPNIYAAVPNGVWNEGGVVGM